MGTYKWSFPSGMVSQINSGKIKLTPTYSSPYETDGAFDVKVVNGATAAVYTITCTTESCETTGKLTIKDCSGGGGDTCDGGIILIESEGRTSGSITLPTEGGTLSFTQQDWYIDDKTLSATDSGRLQVGTLPTAGTWTLTPDSCSWLGALTIEGTKIYAENVTASTPTDMTISIVAKCSDCVSNEPITFEITKKGSSPTPVGDCDEYDWGYHWNRNSEITANVTSYCENILHQAAGCTMPAKSGTNNGVITNYGNYWVEVEIVNSTSDYLPYNGEFYIYGLNCQEISTGVWSCEKTELMYRDHTESYDQWEHYAYGNKPNQPSNLIINPNSRTGFLKCKIADTSYLNKIIEGDGHDLKNRLRVAYSSLNDKSKDKNGQKVIGNLRLHRDLYYYPGMTITFAKGSGASDEDPNVGGSVYFKNHMKVTVTVTDVGSAHHHSFTQSEYNRGWHLYVDSDGELDQLTPTDLYGK